MLVKLYYLGYFPRGNEVSLNCVKIMQSEWELVEVPMFTYGRRENGATPYFCEVFRAEEDGNAVYFAAYERGYAKYHVFEISSRAARKLEKKREKMLR